MRSAPPASNLVPAADHEPITWPGGTEVHAVGQWKAVAERDDATFLFEAINKRYAAGKSTIVTSNKSYG